MKRLGVRYNCANFSSQFCKIQKFTMEEVTTMVCLRFVLQKDGTLKNLMQNWREKKHLKLLPGSHNNSFGTKLTELNTDHLTILKQRYILNGQNNRAILRWQDHLLHRLHVWAWYGVKCSLAQFFESLNSCRLACYGLKWACKTV